MPKKAKRGTVGHIAEVIECSTILGIRAALLCAATTASGQGDEDRADALTAAAKTLEGAADRECERNAIVVRRV